MMDPKAVDLAALAERLRERVSTFPISGYLIGKTWLRDAVASDLDCSLLEAERMVDTLVARGFLEYTGDPSEAASAGDWRICHDV